MDKAMTELLDTFKDMVRCFSLEIKREHRGDFFDDEITDDDIVDMIEWIKNEGYTIQKEEK